MTTRPKPIEPNSDEEWDLEIRAFNAANDQITSPQAPSKPLRWWGASGPATPYSGRSCERTYSLTVSRLAPPQVQTK